MEHLAKYAYDDQFEPMVKARDPRTIPEFVELTGGVITQTAALCAIREVIPEDATIITAGAAFQAVCRESGLPIKEAATMRNTDTPVWDMKWQRLLV